MTKIPPYLLFILLILCLASFFVINWILNMDNPNFLTFLSNNKEGILLLQSIIKDILITIAAVFGGLFSYLILARDLKFSQIKKIISEQSEIKMKINHEATLLKYYFDTSSMEEVSGQQLTVKKTKELYTKLNSLFKYSNLVSTDIANIIYLMEVFLKRIITIQRDYNKLSQKDKREFSSYIEERDLYRYLNIYTDLILDCSSKIEKSPSFIDLLFPNKKVKDYNWILYFLTSTKRQKKINLFEVGVNFQKLNVEIFVVIIQTLLFRNYLFPYALLGFGGYEKYVARTLYLKRQYYPIVFAIKGKSLNGTPYFFRLSKIENSVIFDTKEKVTRLIFIKDRVYESISHERFFNSMEEKNGYYLLKDLYFNNRFRVKRDDIEISDIYGHVNIITIKIKGESEFRLRFIRNLFKIIIDFNSRKSMKTFNR